MVTLDGRIITARPERAVARHASFQRLMLLEYRLSRRYTTIGARQARPPQAMPVPMSAAASFLFLDADDISFTSYFRFGLTAFFDNSR